MTSESALINHQFIDNQKDEAVILLHGFLGSMKTWDNFKSNFCSDFNLLLVDLPGHGNSNFDNDLLEMSYCAKEVIKCCDHYEISRAHFVGHSMGGYVSLEVLKSKSDLVQSLTLLNSTAYGDSEQKKKDRLLAVRALDIQPKEFISTSIQRLFYEKNLNLLENELCRNTNIALETNIQSAKAALMGMRIRKDNFNLIQSTNVPVLYVAGKHDQTIKFETILEQTEHSSAELIELSNSAHMGFLEEPEICQIEILKFIKRH